MIERGRRPDFTREALDPEGGGEGGVQHLHGDIPLPAILAVVREEHRRHAAPADLALQIVAVA